MKLGVSSYSFEKYLRDGKRGYFDICDIAKRIGFDGIEFIDLDWMGLSDNPMKTAGEIREYCRKIGLEISAYTVGADFLSDDIAAEKERLKGCVEVAAELGATLMRHDVCYALPAGRRYTWQDATADMAPHIREIAAYAESRKIRTCTENHGRIFQAPERVEALIRAVNHKNYGWLVDIGNFLGVDEDVTRAVSIALPYIFHVHAKDFICKKGGIIEPEGFMPTLGGNYYRGTIVGHGDVPVATALKTIRKSGYDGYVSLEFEGIEDNITALELGYNYLRRLIG